MKPVSRFRNRLARRLGRHANMAGLFHFSEAVQRQPVRSSEPGMASAANATGYPLAKAFLPAPEPAGEASLSPSSPTPSLAPDAPLSLPLEQPKPISTSMEPPAPVISGNVFRAPEPERSESPIVEKTSQPSGNDPVWNRLQNIFNRHKNKNTSQEPTALPVSAQGDLSSPHLAATDPKETGQESASTGSDSPGGYEPGVSLVPSIQAKRAPANPLTRQPVRAPASGIQSETSFARTEQRPATAEISSETVPSSIEIIQASSKSLPVNPVSASSQADETTSAMSPSDILKNETRETSESTHSEHPSKPSSQPIREAPDTPAPDLQSLPLQAVWAVETARQPQGAFLPDPDVSGQPVSGAEGIQRRIKNTHTEQTTVQRAVVQDQMVRSALQDVHPAQATESGIEFIPPRRPRPVSPPAGSSAPVIHSVEPPVENQQTLKQRSPDSRPENDVINPGVVPTEIGPLPEDLWNLVGAEPPSERPEKIESHQEHLAVSEAAQWERHSPSTNASLPATPRTQAGPAPVVQRQATAAAAPGPGEAPPATGIDTVEGQAGENIDVEELARQVYRELKHRLELEWERFRRH